MQSSHRVNTYRYVNPPVIHYGVGAVQRLSVELERLGIQRLHLVSTASVINSPIIDYLRASTPLLRSASVSTVSGHVPIQQVFTAAREARAANVEAVVAFGGGSAMDAAKLVALGLLFEGLDEECGLPWFKKCLADPKAHRALPVFSIPTTLSAAELYGDAGYTDDESGHKVGIANHAMTGSAVFYDPTVAAETPRELWVSTGLRALDHAVETVLSDDADPLSRALCSSAIADLLRVLPKFASDMGSEEDRLACFVGAWKSYGNPPIGAGGLSHVLGRLTGAKNGIPHGITSCVLLPLVLEHVYEREDRFAGRLSHLEHQLSAEKGDTRRLSQRLRDLLAATGMPQRFRADRFENEMQWDVVHRAAGHPHASDEVVARILAASTTDKDYQQRDIK